MSIMIRGMEMPKDGCRGCLFVNRKWKGDVCQILKREVTGNVERGGFQTDCPLIQVPPHGRLIDADALIEVNADLADCDFIHPRIGSTLREVVEDAPTIIEAEEERA